MTILFIFFASEINECFSKFVWLILPKLKIGLLNFIKSIMGIVLLKNIPKMVKMYDNFRDFNY